MTSSWFPPPSTFHSPPSPLLPNTTGYKPPQPLLFHGNLFTTFLTALPTIAWLAPMAYLYSIMNFWSVESIFIFLVSQWREHGGPLSHLGGSHWIDLVGTAAICEITCFCLLSLPCNLVIYWKCMVSLVSSDVQLKKTKHKTQNWVAWGCLKSFIKDLKAVLKRHANQYQEPTLPYFLEIYSFFLPFSFKRSQSWFNQQADWNMYELSNSLDIFNPESVFWESIALSIGLVLEASRMKRRLHCSHVVKSPFKGLLQRAFNINNPFL